MSELDKHNKNVIDTHKYSVEQFDKNTLFIASGALGISFAFLKDLIPCLACAKYKGQLFISLILFSTVIFLNLVGHFISSLGSSWADKNTNIKDDVFNDKIKYWNIPISIINGATIILILIASILLIYFIIKNI